jgi:hypothetical protein
MLEREKYFIGCIITKAKSHVINMYFIFIKGIKGYSYYPNILNAKPKSKFMMVALDIFR